MKRFQANYMSDDDITNEQFEQKSYTNIFHNPKQRIRVNYIIHQNKTTE